MYGLDAESERITKRQKPRSLPSPSLLLPTRPNDLSPTVAVSVAVTVTGHAQATAAVGTPARSTTPLYREGATSRSRVDSRTSLLTFWTKTCPCPPSRVTS